MATAVRPQASDTLRQLLDAAEKGYPLFPGDQAKADLRAGLARAEALERSHADLLDALRTARRYVAHEGDEGEIVNVEAAIDAAEALR